MSNSELEAMKQWLKKKLAEVDRKYVKRVMEDYRSKFGK